MFSLSSNLHYDVLCLLCTFWSDLLKFWLISFGLVKSHDMPCSVESASLEPKLGNKFIAGGEDMWVHIYDFHTGKEIGKCLLNLRSSSQYTTFIYLCMTMWLFFYFLCILSWIIILNETLCKDTTLNKVCKKDIQKVTEKE